jgi:IS5 family transposase
MAYRRGGGPDAGATDAAVMEHPKAGGAAPRRRQKDRREGPASIPTNWRGQIFDVCTTIPSQTRMKRRAEFELVIGHLTTEHRMDRSHLEGREGDRINAARAAAGYNFGRLLRWLAAPLVCHVRRAFCLRLRFTLRLNQHASSYFTGDYVVSESDVVPGRAIRSAPGICDGST